MIIKKEEVKSNNCRWGEIRTDDESSYTLPTSSINDLCALAIRASNKRYVYLVRVRTRHFPYSVVSATTMRWGLLDCCNVSTDGRFSDESNFVSLTCGILLS